MIRNAALFALVALAGCASAKLEAPKCPRPGAEIGANPAGVPPVVWDDARATYLRFPGHQSIPAVTAERPDGEERAVNSNFDPGSGILTVHGVYPTLILRDGSRTACIYNRAFDQVGR